MSSSKPKAKSSVNQQVKAGISALKDFLRGRSGEARVAEATDEATRQVVAAELLSAMAGADQLPETGERENEERQSKTNARSNSGAEKEAAQAAGIQEQAIQNQEQERARQLFMDHGYFDEVVETLRSAGSSTQRVAAARTLGVVGSHRGTAHLIAAMFDDDEEVRSAAEEALAEISNRAVPKTLVDDVLKDEIQPDESRAPEAPETSQTAEASSTAKRGTPKSQGPRKEAHPPGNSETASAKSTTHDQRDRLNEPTEATPAGPPQARVPGKLMRDRSGRFVKRKGKETMAANSMVEEVHAMAEEAVQLGIVDDATAASEVEQLLQSMVEEVHVTVEQSVQPGIVDDAAAASEIEQLLLEEEAVRETVEQLEGQLAATAVVFQKSENEARWRTEREAQLRAEAEARRLEEAELRKQAEEEAARREAEVKAEAEARQREAEERRKQAEEEAARRDAELRAEVEAQRREAEQLRKQAEEEAEQLRKQAEEEAQQRRAQESKAVAAEQAARLQAEAEAHHLAEEEARLRLEVASLRQAAEELTRQRWNLETARIEAAQAARLADVTRSRDEAEERHQAELERLRGEEEALRTATEEAVLRRSQVEAALQEQEADIKRLTEERAQLAAAEASRRAEADRLRSEAEERNRAQQEELQMQLDGLRKVGEGIAVRRAEVDAAREKADKDAERLQEAQARMRAAEEARDQAELERLEVEAEIKQRVETELRLLEEARHRAQEEQVRLEEEARRHAEAEEHRMAALEVVRKKAELEARQRAEREQQIHSQIDSLRIADAEVRKRIEDAEVRRRASEEAYRLAAEKVQRIEAESHASALEEEQMLAKLETVRRNVAVEAQGRAEQERRIKEEIEMFRRLEEEERPRIEELALQRSAAEARLQQYKERFDSEEEARRRAEERIKFVSQYQPPPAAPVETEQHEDTIEELPPVIASEEGLSSALPEPLVATGPAQETVSVDAGAGPEIPTAIASYLHSVDPYKRAAAVAELARSHAKDAFSLIARCFDDHSPHVRNAAARALRRLEPAKTVDLFNQALEEGSAERRRNIGSAIAASGLATEAIDNLVGESREDTYNSLSILFVMAKTGEVQPLVKAIEEHENEEVCRAVIKLLTLSGQSEIGDAALQRRIMGVAASRQKAGGGRQEGIPDLRLRIAQVEVKKASGKRPSKNVDPESVT